MEIILAALFTILAGVIGVLFVRKLNRQKSVVDKNHAAKPKVIRLDEKSETSTSNIKKLLDDDDKEILIQEKDLSLIENCDSPLEMREYVRYLRKTEFERMSDEERKEEERIQKEQLSNIFSLIQKDEEKLGITSISEMEEQMKLYC